MNRRQVLRGLGAGSLVLVAGCGDGGGSGDGASDDGSGGGNSGSDGSSVGEPSGSGSGSGTTDTPATTTEPGAGTTETTQSGQGPELGDHLALAPDHRMRMELTDYMGEGETVTYEGVWVGDDMDVTMEAQGVSARYVFVDGEVSMVAGGQCLPQDQLQGPDFDAESWADPENFDERLGDTAEIRPAGTTTYEGEPMYVYELDIDNEAFPGPYTYYISRETGYPRYLETEGLTVEYWDWGQVSETITSPC